MHIKHCKSCRICGNQHLTEVIDLGYMYSQGSFNKEGVISAPKRLISNRIMRCDTSKNEDGCGLIQTEVTVPPEILYSNYWYKSSTNESMRSHLASIVREIIDITGLKSGKVLDIAGNDFTMIRNYRNYGDFDMTVVDPSDISSKQTDTDIKLINECFPTEKLPYNEEICSFDVVTSIACFYDLHDPRSFVADIRDLLKRDGIWVFEVAYLPSMLERLMYDSFVVEHIEAYHLAPIEILLKTRGLKLFKVKKTNTNGGSIMCFVCHEHCDKYNNKEDLDNLLKIRLEEFDLELDTDKPYEKFRNEVHQSKVDLYNFILDLKKDNKKVNIYGSSTKLNTILGYCGIGKDLIEYAAERSEEKWGAETISGIKIISEEESREMKPDYYLVGPWHFLKSIIKREEQQILNGAKFIIPLPRLKIIEKSNYLEYI